MPASPALSSNNSNQNSSACDFDRAKELGMSPLMFSGKLSEPTDVRTYRQHFAAVWRDFIVAEFESPAHVAFTFKVDPSTAEKWWVGSHAPQGWVVGRAMADPKIRDAAIKALVEAA